MQKNDFNNGLGTGSPHIRLEQTNFIGRVLSAFTRAERAVC